MWRKVGFVITIIYNFIRLPILYLFTNGKVKFKLPQIISCNAKLRSGNKGSIILGKLCFFEEGTLIRASGGNIHIGDKVYINRNCNIVSREAITLGDNVTIGPNVCIYDHDHNFSRVGADNYKSTPVIIGKNVWIGANSVILRGVDIGENSVIGAGVVVSKSIPKETILTTKSELILRKISTVQKNV